jgi:NAD(P)-dependent dehydrogenase (short-subunit alcohol dehydrogenase family)
VSCIDLLRLQLLVLMVFCRTPASASKLEALKGSAKAKFHILQLDVSDEGSIHKIAGPVKEILGDKGLDYLINNAAVVSAALAGFGA